MKIVVCLKQVPRLDQVRFDRRNRILREDIDLMANPLDLEALAQALELRGAGNGEVVAMTMGPPPAREVLEEAIHRGADRAVHLLDKRFAGADTLATARALAQALEREKPDIVVFGRSTLDGATAQVGPQVAELLGMAQVTQAVSASVEDGRVRVERETERGAESCSSAMPVVISVEHGPEVPEADEGRDGEIAEISAEDLGGKPVEYGTRGSPTFVKEVRDLSLERAAERVEGAEAGARRLAELVSELKHETEPRTGEGSGSSRALWVLAEIDGDRVHRTSLEGIACAREVAAELDAEVVAVLLCADPGKLPAELTAHGADRVLVVRDPSLGEYSTAAFADALCAALEQADPFAVIAPWSAQGRDYVPRVAARLNLGLTGDFVRLEVADGDEEHDPDLLWIKPAWAGTVESPIICHRNPSIGTLRPGAIRALGRSDAADVRIDEIEPRLGAGDDVCVEDRRIEIEDETLLDNAPAVVYVGEGLDAEGVEQARRLAAAMDGSLGATAAAVRKGLVPRQLEVGVLKRSMSPPLVLALGMEEAEDLNAVRGARQLVTVGPDGDASVHGRADLAIISEPAELMCEALERIGEEGE